MDDDDSGSCGCCICLLQLIFFSASVYLFYINIDTWNKFLGLLSIVSASLIFLILLWCASAMCVLVKDCLCKKINLEAHQILEDEGIRQRQQNNQTLVYERGVNNLTLNVMDMPYPWTYDSGDLWEVVTTTQNNPNQPNVRFANISRHYNRT